jgi:hypothetical protein
MVGPTAGLGPPQRAHDFGGLITCTKSRPHVRQAETKKIPLTSSSRFSCLKCESRCEKRASISISESLWILQGDSAKIEESIGILKFSDVQVFREFLSAPSVDDS